MAPTDRKLGLKAAGYTPAPSLRALEVPPPPTAPAGPGEWGARRTLDYGGHPIRTVELDGVPWFCLADICDALGLDQRAMTQVDHPTFPSAAKAFADDGERGEALALLSPVGVWRFTTFTDPGRGQGVAAWSKRESLRLCPDAAPNDPSVYLTYGPDWSLPVRPTRWSGRLLEWEALRSSPAYIRHIPGMQRDPVVRPRP